MGGDMTFYGAEVKPGGSTPLNADDDSSIHISMATLGVKPKKGDRSVLFAEVDGTKHVVCALTTGTCEMAPLDLMFGYPQKVSFSVTGGSTIHLSGYQILDDDGEDDMDGMMQFDDDEEDDEEEDEEEMPAPVKKQSPKQAAKPSPKQSPKQAAKLMSNKEDAEDEEDEEDDEEDDDLMEMLGEEDDEDDEEEDEEEDEEVELPPKKQQGKRAAPSKAAPPAKKAKASPKSTPKATPPAKVKASPKSTPKASPKSTPKACGDGYGKEIVSFLKSKGGKANLASIGGSVKKPPGTPKLKEYLKKNADRFKVDGDSVTLK